jgi:acetyl esterase/lipase
MIRHKGAVNAGAAVSWALENVPAPGRLAVVGCSAGGYGSILWAAHLMARYPGATAVQLSDSAAGVVPAGFFATIAANWGLESAWPGFIPALAPGRLDPSGLTLTDFYSGVAGHYPLGAFSQFNTLADSTQVLFASLAQGFFLSPEDWSARMQASSQAIRAANPNFHAYTAPGSQHCVVNRPEFYTTSVNGTRFVDWVQALATSGRPGSVP